MKKLLAAVTAICVLLSLCACGAENTKQPNGNNQIPDGQTNVSSKEETSKFEVTVTDADGNPVKGVMVQLCKDTCVPSMTDENGIAIFNAEITDEHKLSVMSCPEGYEYIGEAEIYLEDGDTSYTLEITKK